MFLTLALDSGSLVAPEVLSLVQQVGFTIMADPVNKLSWLKTALLALDVNDDLIAPHLPVVLAQVTTLLILLDRRGLCSSRTRFVCVCSTDSTLRGCADRRTLQQPEGSDLARCKSRQALLAVPYGRPRKWRCRNGKCMTGITITA